MQYNGAADRTTRRLAWTAAGMLLLLATSPTHTAAQGSGSAYVPPLLPTSATFGGFSAGVAYLETGDYNHGFGAGLQLLHPVGSLVVVYAANILASLPAGTCALRCSWNVDRVLYATVGGRFTRPLDASRLFAGASAGVSYRELQVRPTFSIESGAFVPLAGDKVFLAEVRVRFDQFRFMNVHHNNRSAELLLGLLWKL